tara:strand:- start:318 stop:1004 length:687 start_codon:yes stop_codon:yes gene_type:complete
MRVSQVCLAVACASGLGLAGCSEADSATFDTALEDDPCAVVTTQMVASTFDVPEADIDQSNVVSSQCVYELDSDGKALDVEVSVEAYDTDEDAAEAFQLATQSMSSEEISDAMTAVQQQANADGDLETEAQQDAAAGVGAGVSLGAIEFEDVEGVADQARFNTSDGTLELQEGNLRIRLKAYYGPEMPIPESYEPGAMLEVINAWIQDTNSERKAQSVALAKAALAEL